MAPEASVQHQTSVATEAIHNTDTCTEPLSPLTSPIPQTILKTADKTQAAQAHPFVCGMSSGRNVRDR